MILLPIINNNLKQKSMGNDHNNKAPTTEKIKLKEATPISDALNLKKYNKISVIGRGGFGRVN